MQCLGSMYHLCTVNVRFAKFGWPAIAAMSGVMMSATCRAMQGQFCADALSARRPKPSAQSGQSNIIASVSHTLKALVSNFA